MRRLLSIASLVLLAACSQKTSAPECQTDPSHTIDVQANGGCFIKNNGQLLVIRQRNNAKLAFPGGTNKVGESAQCTAHRETWEEAGLPVNVGRTLHVFNNGFYLFECTLKDNIDTLKTKDLLEVKAVLWIDPTNTSKNDWRFSNQYELIIELFQSQR